MLTACGDDAKTAEEIRREKQEEFEREVHSKTIEELRKHVGKIYDEINELMQQLEAREKQ